MITPVAVLISSVLVSMASAMSMRFTATQSPSQVRGFVNAGPSQLKMVCNPQRSCGNKAATKSDCIRMGCCWNGRQCNSNKLIFLKFCPGGNCLSSCASLFNFNRVNLVFALDASGSVDDAEFIWEKEFIKTVVDRLDVTRTAVGLLQYASSAVVEIPLGFGKSREEIKSLVDGVVQLGGGTYSEKAIEKGTEMFGGITYDVNNDNNVFVFTNDGASNGPGSIQDALDAMDAAAVVSTTRYSVGIDGSLLNELQQIASTDDKAVYGDYFDDLPSFVNALAASIVTVGC